MPSKLFVHVEPENHFVGPTDFVELCRLPLEVGRPYLVQARGLAGLEGGVSMTLRLDVCGFFGQVISSRESSYINDHQQFLLTAAAKLPAEGGGGSAGTPIPPGASANLFVTDDVDRAPTRTLGLHRGHRADRTRGRRDRYGVGGQNRAGAALQCGRRGVSCVGPSVLPSAQSELRCRVSLTFAMRDLQQRTAAAARCWKGRGAGARRRRSEAVPLLHP